MLDRVLEPEWMDTPQEADTYTAMDHSAANAAFLAAVEATVEAAPVTGAGAHGARWLDVCCGPADIPARLAARRDRRVVAVDAAGEMLRVAAARHPDADVAFVRADAKRLPFSAAGFDAVVSNASIHHIPEPADVFREIARVARPDAVVVLRDLLRPRDEASLDALVEQYAGGEPAFARRLFADSLRAALTVEEVAARAMAVGLGGRVEQTSDRHWTLTRSAAP